MNRQRLTGSAVPCLAPKRCFTPGPPAHTDPWFDGSPDREEDPNEDAEAVGPCGLTTVRHGLA